MRRREVDNGGGSPREVRSPPEQMWESILEQFGGGARRYEDAMDNTLFFSLIGHGEVVRVVEVSIRGGDRPQAAALVGGGRRVGWGARFRQRMSERGCGDLDFFHAAKPTFLLHSGAVLVGIILSISEPKLPEVGPSCGQSLGGLVRL